MLWLMNMRSMIFSITPVPERLVSINMLSSFLSDFVLLWAVIGKDYTEGDK